ncbi:MAG: methyltransferase [Pirellulales bacterium]
MSRFEQILDTMNAFKGACVLGAAAELDLFTAVGSSWISAGEAAARAGADPRATTILLDVLAAMGLLEKHEHRYRVPLDLEGFLTEDSPRNILPMIRHQTNCLRGWGQLARVAKEGSPVRQQTSIRGAEADRASFIGAMHNLSDPVAGDLVDRMGPPRFRRLLDVGGASGTWTMAFLRAVPEAEATIFDLPDAIEMARARLAETEFAARIKLVAGDFYTDPLPGGADYAWVSAILHQNSRAENVALLAKVHAALAPGGRIGIRDIVMDADRTRPVAGALFAVNMLVFTPGGGTFTFDEMREDLEATGFTDVVQTVCDEGMNAVVEATKAT